MSRVTQSPAARRDLKEIANYIVARSDRERARSVLRTIGRKMELYATMPLGGQERNELHPGLRSFSVYNYVVFYSPTSTGIDVKRVLHGSRDLNAQD